MFYFLYIFPFPTPIPKKSISCQEKNPWSNVGVSDDRETNEGYSVGLHFFFLGILQIASINCIILLTI